MSFLKDVLDFEQFNAEGFGKELKARPWRLLTGVDQGSTSVWNKILNRDDKPLTNWVGGPSGDTYAAAGAEGINTGSAHKLHDIGEAVVGYYLGSQFVPTGGETGGAGVASNSAKMRMFGAGLQNAGQAMDASSANQPMRLDDYRAQPLQYQDQYAQQYGYSSKKLKNKKGSPKSVNVMDALECDDPIDQNGAEIALIQALTERVTLLKRKLATLKSRRRG